MRIEGPLRATAYTAANFAVFTFNRQKGNSGQWFCTPPPLQPDTTPITIKFGIGLPPAFEGRYEFRVLAADLTFDNTRPGCCHFTLNCSDGFPYSWPALQLWWERFVDELEEMGWSEVGIEPLDDILESEPTPQQPYDETGGSMKVQERLNVTPYNFYGFALIFWNVLLDQGKSCHFRPYRQIHTGPLLPGTTPVFATLETKKKEKLLFTAVESLPGKSRLIIECADEHWPTLQPWWQRFKAELIREGLLEGAVAPLVAPVEPDLTPRGQYDTIIRQAQARAIQKGLSIDTPPTDEAGGIEIAEWFLAFWVPRGRTLEKYKQKFTRVGSRMIDRYWEEYRETHNIPTLRDLDKLRQDKAGEN